MTILTGRTKVLAVTISMIVLAGQASSALADDRGALGGMLGGIVGGTSKAVGGIMGDLGALASSNGEAVGIVKNDDNKILAPDLGAPDSVAAKPELKAKSKVGDTDTKVGAKVPDEQKKVAGAKAKTKIKAVLSGPAKTKAKAAAKVATKTVGAKVAVPSGEADGSGYDVGSNDDGIGNELAGLSSYERLQLKRKCVYVLSSPLDFNRDAVQVCRVLAQSAGL